MLKKNIRKSGLGVSSIDQFDKRRMKASHGIKKEYVHILKNIIVSHGGTIEGEVPTGYWITVWFSPDNIYEQVMEDWNKWIEVHTRINQTEEQRRQEEFVRSFFFGKSINGK